MGDDYELNKLGWFTVQFVEANDFLNQKLTDDKYGTWFTVKFVGDASTHLWMAKNAPTAGEKVYGHIEKTSSGKSTKFKRAPKDQIPAEQGAQSTSTHQPNVPHNTDQQESIARSVALKAAVDLIASLEGNESKTWSAVVELAELSLAWLQGTTTNKPSSFSTGTPKPEDVNPMGSGYEQAKATASRIKERQEDEQIKEFVQSDQWHGDEPLPEFLGE